MKYLLDANVFIQAHRFYYPFDVFPAFRAWLEAQNQEQKVFSITEIYDELKKGQDTLWEWVARQDKTSWFLPNDEEETQSRFTDIADWTGGHSQFKDTAKKEFLDVADPWLIAKAEDYTIVTQEKSDPKSKGKVFIPDVCNHFNIKWINTMGLLRELGGKF